ncbi:MAG: nucleoside diphosphate kinase regulator [Acidobacteria bacterium]|nr:nucleoside diphosphate kinase regulator [Acidobacteriota bacterium]
MSRRRIHITQVDLMRLKRMILEFEQTSGRDQRHLGELQDELRRAKIVASSEVPPEVITMNSRVRIQDLHSGEEMVLTLAYPAEADIDRQRISVLAPVGTALLGYKVGDVISWSVPAGTRRFKVLEMLYQPEAAGDFNR